MLVACRLADLSALEAHYAGLVAIRQTKGGCAGRGGFIRFRPSIASPSIKNMSGDKHHDESDQSGGGDHLSLSKHYTHGAARVACGSSLGLLSRAKLLSMGATTLRSLIYQTAEKLVAVTVDHAYVRLGVTTA
jgi:hypothetical protein